MAAKQGPISGVSIHASGVSEFWLQPVCSTEKKQTDMRKKICAVFTLSDSCLVMINIPTESGLPDTAYVLTLRI
jgi:hypothetical protein